jgi:protein-S-isoprenylcysteine O-methyltransferase Ste14
MLPVACVCTNEAAFYDNCEIRRRSPVKLNILTLAIVVVAGICLAVAVGHLAWTPWRIAGLAILAPSFVLFATARMQLGRAFSIQAKASTLVTSGLYSRIRNPIYVFGALMVVGLSVFSRQPWFLLVLAALIPLQVYRSRKESQVLEEKFGAAYVEYKRKTWF